MCVCIFVRRAISLRVTSSGSAHTCVAMEWPPAPPREEGGCPGAGAAERPPSFPPPRPIPSRRRRRGATAPSSGGPERPPQGRLPAPVAAGGAGGRSRRPGESALLAGSFVPAPRVASEGVLGKGAVPCTSGETGTEAEALDFGASSVLAVDAYSR